MGKRSQKPLVRRQGSKISCMSGLIRIFYSRHDAKLLLDRKQGSRRHTFSAFHGGIAIWSYINLEHDVCLDKSSMQNSKSNGDPNHSTSVTMSAPTGYLDPNGSNCMEEAEENELKFALADFLGQIHRCHDENPHQNSQNKGELCSELKVLIQTKLNELDNAPCRLGYKQTPEYEENSIADGKRLCSSSVTQPKKFRDALEMLSSDTELFLKILQKSNSHVLESVQEHHNRQIGTRLVPTKIQENKNCNKDTKILSQHEFTTKTHSKGSRHISFWKDRSNRRHSAEGANISQPIKKIVILKPNPIGGIEPAVSASSTQDPELSASGSSKFSIKEVRRRFSIVTSEARKGRPSVCEDNLQKDQHWFKSSAFTIKKGPRQLAEQTSEEKVSSTATIKGSRSSTSSIQMQRNDGPNGINSSIITSSKDGSAFYDEAKKHLTEILKDKSQMAKYPTLQISRSRSLVRMLSLPQCSTPSPRSSPRAKDCIYLSPEESNIDAIYKAKREKFAKEESQSGEISESVACEAQHEQDGHWIKQDSQEITQDDAEPNTLRTEQIDKLDCLGKDGRAWCIPVEQCRYKPLQDMVEVAEPVQEHVGMVPSSPENDVPECQEPTTPRSSAPDKLISQFSHDGNHEKQEQPSPVSVLDSFFNEDVNSPNNENIIKCELHEDILRPQYTTGNGSDQGVFWEDKDVRLGYIKELLELTELCTYQNLEVWYLEDELISPCLFEELHQGNQVDDMKLFFDCICEAVTEVQGIYFRSHACLSSPKHNIRGPPMGGNLISEINKHVERHLHYQFPTTLDQLVCMDLEGDNWMDLQSESEEIIVVIWDCILDELLEEVVYDLWI